MMVVLFHLHLAILPDVRAWLPAWVSSIFEHGNLGVEIFFVLSGFVIAHSTRDAERSWRFLGRFGLRRSIRLDPPMWATIFLEIVVRALMMRWFPSRGASLPTFGEVVANMTYTQEFLGIPNVVTVLWSLTFEVQFYIALVAGLILFGAAGESRRRIGHTLLLLSLAYSLAIWMQLVPPPLRGLFIDRWYQFGLGILAWLVFSGRLRLGWGVVALLAVLSITLSFSPNSYRLATSVATVVTAGALMAAGHLKTMSLWLSGALLQFLGRISYSLYLVHGTVGWRFIALCRELMGGSLGPVMALLVFLGGVCISITAAWIMYRLLEVPSIAIARRVSLPRSQSAVS